jgi:hypothetical protein
VFLGTNEDATPSAGLKLVSAFMGTFAFAALFNKDLAAPLREKVEVLVGAGVGTGFGVGGLLPMVFK